MVNPFVLLVDDEPDSVRHLVLSLRASDLNAQARHPSDIPADLVDRATLVLVDFHLGEWCAPTLPLAQRPPDGLAVAHTLRRHASKLDHDPPTGFSILSGELQELASPLPVVNRASILSRLNNLEWVLAKDDEALAAKVVSLVSAIDRLPANWGADADSCEEALAAYLGLEGMAWELNRDAILATRPPVADLSTWSHGIAVVRWLAHRVLPYPTFVWSDAWLAARLWTTTSSLQDKLDTNGALSSAVNELEYAGPLAQLFTRRWWREGVEQWLWDLSGGRSSNADAVHDALRNKFGVELPRVAGRDLVVVIDGDLNPADSPIPMEDAIQIQPDDWPPYADNAWMAP